MIDDEIEIEVPLAAEVLSVRVDFTQEGNKLCLTTKVPHAVKVAEDLARGSVFALLSTKQAAKDAAKENSEEILKRFT